jgi:hypothetical protein
MPHLPVKVAAMEGFDALSIILAIARKKWSPEDRASLTKLLAVQDCVLLAACSLFEEVI